MDIKQMPVHVGDDDITIETGVSSTFVTRKKAVALRLENLLDRRNIAEVDRFALRVAVILVRASGCDTCDGTGKIQRGYGQGLMCACQENLQEEIP